MPSAIRDKSLDEIAITFQSSLGTLVDAFRSQAVQVAQWDRQVLINQERLVRVLEDAQRAEQVQERLEKDLDFVLSQQNEMHQSLTAIEEQVKDLIDTASERPRGTATTSTGALWSTSGSSLTGAVERERQRHYELAAKVRHDLDQVYTMLEQTITELNGVYASGSGGGGHFRLPPTHRRNGGGDASGADARDESAAVLTILNVHLDMLGYLDEQRVEMERRLGELEKLLRLVAQDPRYARAPDRESSAASPLLP